MDIIIDNGAHTLRNMGDVAMLQVALQRLTEMLPQARPWVLTSRPDLLARYCPNAQPLSAASRDATFLQPATPRTRPWAAFWRRKSRVDEEFQSAFDRAPAILLTGGGYLNDANARQTRATLRMLTQAVEQGKRVALFGQGLGPMQDPEFCGLLGQICRAGTPVGLRENRVGPALLKSIGARTMTLTGDDAIELARNAPARTGRQGLGFSLRVADYAGLSDSHLHTVQAAYEELKSALQAEVVPLPVSFNNYEDDPESLSRITGSPLAPDGLDTPMSLVQRAGACRLILTGTYHAAVFALAQGVPCVAFYASDYYRIKMEGLADLFPAGCHLVDLREPDPLPRVVTGCKALWKIAPELEGTLRATALAQVVRAREFYREVLAQAAQPDFNA